MTITSTDTSTELLTRLRKAYATGRTRDAGWRIRQLRGIEKLADEREAEIAAALQEDLGRNAVEAWLGDVASTRAEAAYARKRVRRWMLPRPKSLSINQFPALGWVQYEPMGVVLIIAPWNYPVYLTLGPLVAAVAAGNCAVIKPSELAPATSALLARLIPQYLDPEAVVVAEGDAELTQSLLAQGFDLALYTGGTEVGRKIMAAAAPQLTPVILELGGKSPVIVAEDADLEVTARRIAWIKLLNSGQSCIAPDYVLVERSVRDGLVDKIVDTIALFRSEEPQPGMRVVNHRHFDRLEAYLESTTGRIVTGGRCDRDTLTVEPTAIVDPAPDDPVMTDEIFGPILPILTVDSVDAALDFIGARPKPLAAYVFSKSLNTQKKITQRISAGGVVVNHVGMHVLAPQLPFGGVGASGMGAYHGRYGFEALSHRKAVLVKPFRPDPAMNYPPYTQAALKIMRRLF
ncbi:aldehyde dehydrogenase family protein [Rhodococcus aetherivorans]|uniref:aldehyde dehydrogenase family protein n=1 Tax=Rhodococcus aetherivorans TaxID=191292 RepID=UPI00045D127E|nr:aldehyde dehydrogenase family protein [Rhodococcus aetherivorans]KDE13216.1 aldehyde dehydrogenase [Rhodococcus aetherivorans]